MAVKILAFSGSLRGASWNKQLVKIASEGARLAGAEVTLLELKSYPLPIYDEDLEREHGLPPQAVKLKELFKSHQGLLIASPEYNSSVSAALKNLIDWVSRPAPGETALACFDGKVAALMSASPGALGGLRGLVTLRSILGNIRVTLLPDQIAIAKAGEAFDESGQLKNADQTAQVKSLGAKLVLYTKKLQA